MVSDKEQSRRDRQSAADKPDTTPIWGAIDHAIHPESYNKKSK